MPSTSFVEKCRRLTINPDAESHGLFPICHREVPHISSPVSVSITLDFSAEKICRLKFNRSFFFPFIFNKWQNIVVNDMTTAPSSKLSRFQKVKFVVSHLIIRDEYRAQPWKSTSRTLSRHLKVTILSRIRLI